MPPQRPCCCQSCACLHATSARGHALESHRQHIWRGIPGPGDVFTRAAPAAAESRRCRRLVAASAGLGMLGGSSAGARALPWRGRGIGLQGKALGGCQHQHAPAGQRHRRTPSPAAHLRLGAHSPGWRAPPEALQPPQAGPLAQHPLQTCPVVAAPAGPLRRKLPGSCLKPSPAGATTLPIRDCADCMRCVCWCGSLARAFYRS